MFMNPMSSVLSMLPGAAYACLFQALRRLRGAAFMLSIGVVCLCPGMLRAEAVQNVETGIGFGLEYNDNVKEEKNGEGDFITHIKPSLKYEYGADRVSANLSYKGDYQYYTGGTSADDYAHTLDARLSLAMVENLLFLDISENLRPVYRQASRGDVVEYDTRRDQTDQNIFSVSPYFTLHPGERTNIKAGYRFSDIRYAEESAPGEGSTSIVPGWSSGQSAMDSNVKQQHELFANAERDVTELFTLLFGYELLRQESEEQTDFHRHKPYLGGRYEYSDSGSVQVRAGPMLTETDDGEESTSFYYLAGVAQKLGRAVLTFDALRDFTEDPESGRNILRTSYTAGVGFTFDRSSLNASLGYAEYEQTIDAGGTKFWRPGMRYIYELTDRLKANVAVSAELDAGSSSLKSDRYYASTGLNYELSETSWVGITYRFKNVDTEGHDDDFTVNRIMLEWGMTF